MTRSNEEAQQTIRTVATRGPLPNNNKQHVQQYVERDWFQRPKASERPEHSAGWDAKPEWSGASWSGERWSGSRWGGGRER
jgi:hypothetical protein